MSLYARYLKERQGIDTIENEDGFATYSYIGRFCYIIDIYVVPEKRKTNLASKMADEITKLAKEAGYSSLLGSVDESLKHSVEASKAVLLAYGFKQYKRDSSNKNLVYFRKEI